MAGIEYGKCTIIVGGQVVATGKLSSISCDPCESTAAVVPVLTSTVELKLKPLPLEPPTRAALVRMVYGERPLDARAPGVEVIAFTSNRLEVNRFHFHHPGENRPMKRNDQPKRWGVVTVPLGDGEEYSFFAYDFVERKGYECEDEAAAVDVVRLANLKSQGVTS